MPYYDKDTNPAPSTLPRPAACRYAWLVLERPPWITDFRWNEYATFFTNRYFHKAKQELDRACVEAGVPIAVPTCKGCARSLEKDNKSVMRTGVCLRCRRYWDVRD